MIRFNFTKFNYMSTDWQRIKNHCRTTVGKEYTEKEPTEEFKKKLLISEHTPIRILNFHWKWKDIKYFVAMEWARHKFEKFITSQRNDRQSNYDRNKAPQDSPVNFDGYANMQNLIDAWRKRLCFQATKEARELAEDFKKELHEWHPDVSNVLVPNCIYRMGCPEFYPCGFYNNFKNWVWDNKKKILCDLTIQERYDYYNEYFNDINKKK